jgi:hypothetical protein
VGDDEVVAPVVIDYTPRKQFIPYHARLQRFACLVCHRRAGKTVATVHDMQRRALSATIERGRYAYIAPYLKQAKTVAWDYLTQACGPLRQYGCEIHQSELRVDYPNGAQIRLFGSDNMDAMRGIYLDGAVMDEVADFDPRVYPEVIRPALSDRQGWATFIGTPRGRNEFFLTYDRALKDPEHWFSMMLKASETGILPEEELRAAREDMSEDQYAQEYECSFDAAIPGAYYAKIINEIENRTPTQITSVPYDPALQTWTAWDLGMRDATAIWWLQPHGKGEVRVIDYYEASGMDLAHYVNQVKNRNYVYGGHILPHDVQVTELSTGKTRLETLESLGLRHYTEIAPKHRVEDGVNAVRVFLPRCWFDAKKCKRGIDALRAYHSAYDERLKALRANPVHDWTSHAADAFRYAAMTLDNRADRARFTGKIEYPNVGVA